MKTEIQPVARDAILPFRDMYRDELHCQIVHDSAHVREGFVEWHQVLLNGEIAGYGATWIGAYWMPKGSVFEFYVLPAHRCLLFPLFQEFVRATNPRRIYAQTNDPFLGLLIYDYVQPTEVGHILFADAKTTAHPANGALFRRSLPEDKPRIFEHKVEPVGNWLLEHDGQIIATGGVLYHYNRPYGDIFMEVQPEFRRRGFGTYLVQELKALTYREGSLPKARTKPVNVASRRTLESAGFAPCARLIWGDLAW